MSTTPTKEDIEWDKMIEVSKNALVTVGTYGYTCWINENYVSELPNYHLSE